MKSLESEAMLYRIIDKAVEAADRVLMEESDGTREGLQYLTCELARHFATKASLGALTELHRRELSLTE